MSFNEEHFGEGFDLRIVADTITLRFAAKEHILGLADKLRKLRFGRKGT